MFDMRREPQMNGARQVAPFGAPPGPRAATSAGSRGPRRSWPWPGGRCATSLCLVPWRAPRASDEWREEAKRCGERGPTVPKHMTPSNGGGWAACQSCPRNLGKLSCVPVARCTSTTVGWACGGRSGGRAGGRTGGHFHAIGRAFNLSVGGRAVRRTVGRSTGGRAYGRAVGRSDGPTVGRTVGRVAGARTNAVETMTNVE